MDIKNTPAPTVGRFCKAHTWVMGVAEIVDDWRLFPRLFVIAYGILAFRFADWAMDQQALTMQQAGMVTAVIALAPPLLNWYMNTGRSWPQSTYGGPVPGMFMQQNTRRADLQQEEGEA